jgi:integrase
MKEITATVKRMREAGDSRSAVPSRVHLKMVSEMLGHSEVSITLRIYGHVLPNFQQNAADVANRLISGPTMEPQ